MGQMSYGLLWGVRLAPPKACGWNDVISNYKHDDRIDVPYDGSGGTAIHVGVWLAVGGSGKSGVPFLDDLDISDLPRSILSDRLVYAKREWAKFAEYVKASASIVMPLPAPWLVQTEVA